ncbi:hypothetical protein [Paenibacillus jiagnxiensis]|uniref:hypothetical protein n=1 Tax=Paenibacillus jiagnxiensis TaxID=3228926 RepID=UPI0033B2941E
MLRKIWFTYGVITLLAGLMAACSSDRNNSSSEPVNTVPAKTESNQQASEEPRSIDLGKAEKGTYINDYFGVSFSYPEEWHVLDAEALNEVVEVGSDMIQTDSALEKMSLKWAQKRVLNLFEASQFPLSESTPNTSVMVVAEKILKLQNINSGAEYLEASKKILMKSELPYEFEPIIPVTVGGKTFDVMKASIDFGGNEIITQYYYSILLDNYTFNIITTSYDDESQAVVQKIIDSVTFK